MSRISYYRVSTGDQSVEAQRQALGGNFDREFEDVGVSGAVKAEDRPGFSQLLRYVREGDTIHVYSIDRLGRDALDVQAMVRRLLDEGVTLDVRGLGVIGRGVGELIVAVLAQMADMERHRIRERCESGRAAARVALAETGRTHKGKVSMGRPTGRRAGKEDVTPAQVVAWRRENSASIKQTAEHFGVGKATVTRYCAAALTDNAQAA
ncbi:recombinase family protein [Sphingobium sufflavum]|uniref:recombinase family protein n=1 Tax=Sphingobium sufflavum TaxID=1129547 RepID=UPI001F1ED3AE|nr:recombinase family protein [Sphingobium sufflavum]MCE7797091.1 recombinase family protein [Sphingobium sufflavum]